MKEYGSIAVEHSKSEELYLGVRSGSSNGEVGDFIPISNKQRTKIHKWVSYFTPSGLVVIITCIALLTYTLYSISCFCRREHAESWIPIQKEEFEYIVVGGGPAGIIVATKLAQKLEAEDANRPGRVLLLESGTSSQSSVTKVVQDHANEIIDGADVQWGAGTQNLNKFDIPLMWSGISNSPGRRDRAGLSSEASRSPTHWPMKPLLLARALGGCGLLNAMIYIRALSTDFDNWPDEWSWESMLNHYKELEKFDESHSPTPPYWKDEKNDDKHWRGQDGPITTTPAGPAIDIVAPLFLESFLAAGLSLASRGFNHPDPGKRVGAGYYEFNIAGGVRASVAASIIGKGSLPSNLVIKTDATVSRVIMDNSVVTGKPRAVGVEFFSCNQSKPSQSATVSSVVKTTREVILSAGAIMTPQLLANSGISEGGKVKDLPGVGKNLQDHPAVAIAFRITPKMAERATSIYSFGGEMEDYTLAVDLIKGFEGNKNVSSSQIKNVYSHLGTIGTSGFSAGAFLRSPWAVGPSPDLQLTVFPRVVEPHVIDRTHEIYKERAAGGDSVEIPIESSAMLVTVALLKPEARYEVKTSSVENRNLIPTSGVLTDKNNNFWGINFTLPSVQLPPNRTSYLSDLDIKRLAWGVEEVRRIRSFAPLSLKTEEEMYPGSKIVEELLDNHVKVEHLTNSHWSGSTKMGSANDPTAVVDERLRVIGVENLRVADAGVMPRVPNGNTHSTVCVLASRAADLIFEDRTTKM